MSTSKMRNINRELSVKPIEYLLAVVVADRWVFLEVEFGSHVGLSWRSVDFVDFESI